MDDGLSSASIEDDFNHVAVLGFARPSWYPGISELLKFDPEVLVFVGSMDDGV